MQAEAGFMKLFTIKHFLGLMNAFVVCASQIAQVSHAGIRYSRNRPLEGDIANRLD